MTRTLEALREQIDAVDLRLLELLLERQALAREIGRLKAGLGQTVVQPARAGQMLAARREAALRLGLEPDFIEALWLRIHEESCRQQALVVHPGVLENTGGTGHTAGTASAADTRPSTDKDALAGSTGSAADTRPSTDKDVLAGSPDTGQARRTP